MIAQHELDVPSVLFERSKFLRRVRDGLLQGRPAGFIHGSAPDLRSPSLSGCVFLEVPKTLWDVTDEAKQHVHGGSLDVSAGFPARDRIATEPQKPGKLGLRQTVPFSDRADLVCGEQGIPGAISVEGALTELAGLVYPQNHLVTLGTAQMRRVRNGNLFTVNRKSQGRAPLAHCRSAVGACVFRKDSLGVLPGASLVSWLSPSCHSHCPSS